MNNSYLKSEETKGKGGGKRALSYEKVVEMNHNDGAQKHKK